ncbi:M16 family metallopeptidase [Pseudomonas sp. X10]
MPSSPAQSGIANAVPAPSLQYFILPNGLTVYVREDHRTPLVCAQLWYHIGASHEPPGHFGLSHLLEHLMFEGSRKLAPGQYSKVLNRLGGKPSAFTLDDATVFDATLPSSRLEIVLEAMADAMASASLGEAEFARALEVVKAEHRLKVDNVPDVLADMRHRCIAFGDSPYATSRYDHLADLQGMSLERLRAWYQSGYHPNNATLVVVGDIDLQRLQQITERHFGTLQAAAHLLTSAPPRTAGMLQERHQALTLHGLRDGLIISFNTPSLATARSPETVHALRLALQLLAKGSGARLYRELVRKRPVLRGYISDYDHVLRGDTLLGLQAYTNPEEGTPKEAAEHVWAIIESIRQTPPTLTELERAKAQLLAQQTFTLDDIRQQAIAIGQHAVSGLDPALMEQDQQAIEAISGENIQQAAQLYLSRERLATTYLLAGENAHE